MPGDAAAQGGPGDTAQFPPITDATEAGGHASGGRGQGGNGSTTGQFNRPAQGRDQSSTTGQFNRPGRNDDALTGTGQFPQAAPADPLGSTTGQFNRPAQGHDQSSATGQFARPGRGDDALTGTGQFPQATPADPLGSTTGQFAQPSPGGQPNALPPAGAGEARTPLFEELESNWFREEQSNVPEQPADTGRPAPRRGDAVRRPAPQDAPSAPADGGNWRESPNDERWRRAEQVREPAAGGTTSSGLPRRVPRANLVEGTAETQSLPTGPQVSRAPDDVRGRLTNLRRGIQQGRQAGNGPATGNTNVGPTYQQER